MKPRPALLDNPVAYFALIIAIAGISAIAIGGDPRVSLLSWPALVVTFWLGRKVGRDEA